MKYYNTDTQELPFLAKLRKNYNEIKIPGTTA
jgi:hypothetical protein